MRMKLAPIQTQKQVLSPMMQQSIQVLLLPLMDLSQAIEQELQNNPLLEVNEEVAESGDSNETDHAELPDESPLPPSNFDSDDDPVEEKPIKRDETLEEQLLRQLHVEFSDPDDILIGEFIIGNIDDDGYLTLSCDEIAQILELDDRTTVESVLKIIQGFEPVGIASRDLKECLLIQLRHKNFLPESLLVRIVAEYLAELGRKKFSVIAKNTGASLSEVKEAAKIITTLDPRPARNFRPLSPQLFVKPDITIGQDTDGNYFVQLNHDGLPRLRINPQYRRILKKEKLTNEEKEFIREKIKNAQIFIKSIEQRGQTIKGIAQYILDRQKAFFENGPISLTPMSLKDVAQHLERNESTISRAIHEKYLDTPYGLFPMRFFFSQGVRNNPLDGSAETSVSSRSIKEEIKKLIDRENKSSPLSDQEIQEYFSKKGMIIARRTISKYRQALRILPSHLRKE